MTQHPEVLWAQRSSATDEAKNIIYLTVNLPNVVKDSLQCDLTPTNISFKASAGVDEKKEFSFEFPFYAEIDTENSSRRLNDRSFFLVLRKKEKQEEFWPRLTKEKIRNAFLKTDFSKWVDEDEQEGAAVAEEEDMDPMGGMGGGMPGMGGMGGGMPGGAGGMDFEKMMAQMGGGAGGMPDFSGAGASGSGAGDDEEDDSDDDGPPPLEDAEPPK